MDSNFIATIVAGTFAIVASFFVSRYYYQKSIRVGSKSERISNARREIVRLLSNSISNDESILEFPLIESWLKSKYREHKVDYSPTEELPIVIDDLITLISEDIFISPEKKATLQERASSLKTMIEKRESSLEDVLEEWNKSSMLIIISQSVAIAFLAFAAGFLVIVSLTVLSVLFKIPITSNLTVLISLVTLFAIISGFTQYKALQAKRDERSKNLHSALEDKGISALEKSVPAVELESNVLSPNGTLLKVDLVIASKGNKIPVEIKHGLVSGQTIQQIVEVMNEMGSNKGLILTSSRVSNKMMDLTRSKNIIVIENVSSEQDIIRRLKNTRLFN